MKLPSLDMMENAMNVVDMDVKLVTSLLQDAKLAQMENHHIKDIVKMPINHSLLNLRIKLLNFSHIHHLQTPQTVVVQRANMKVKDGVITAQVDSMLFVTNVIIISALLAKELIHKPNSLEIMELATIVMASFNKDALNATRLCV